MNLRFIPVLAIIGILITTGCLFSRVDEQKIDIKIEGLLDHNRGYVLIPALVYGFTEDDPRIARVSEDLVDDWGWTIEDVFGMPYMNISVKYDIDISKKVRDPEPSYFRDRYFDPEIDMHQIRIYLEMEIPQNMTITLYSMHSDDYHWFASEATGFIGEGWNSISVFYHLEEA